MPPAPAARPTGAKGRLTAKVGPLPVYAWALLIVGGYLAYRHFAGTGSSGSSASPTTPGAGDVGGTLGGSGDTSGAAGGGSFSSGPDPSSGSYDALVQLLGQQTAALGDLSAQVQAGTPYVAAPTQAGTPYVAAPLPDAPAPSAPGTYLDTVPPDAFERAVARGPSTPNQPYATPATAPDFGSTATQKTAAAHAAGKAAPFGGVVNVKTLANGSQLTTYASGRQVQQVPGKSAYVVKA